MVNPQLLVQQILKANMEKQVVVFGNRELVKQVQRFSRRQVAIMPKWWPEYVRKPHQRLRLMGLDVWIDQVQPDAVEINADIITSAICRTFHQQGIYVQAKTLGEWDSPKFWDKVLAAKVNWIQTDFPEELIAHRLSPASHSSI